MNRSNLVIISKALNAAIEKADDTKKWVGEIPQSDEWINKSTAAVKDFESSLLKLFKIQMKRYVSKVKKAKVKIAKGDDDDIKAVQEEIAAIQEEYDKLYKEKIDRTFLEIVNTVAKEMLKLTGREEGYTTISFDLLNEPAKVWLENKRIKFVKEVAETTHKAVINSLTEGFKAGEGIPELVNRIKELPEFSTSRATLVARTEVISSSNAGTLEGYKQSGVVVGKEWLATADGRTRPTHAAANGQKKKLDEPFIVGGYKMMQPGDSSMGAPAEEVIQDRCTIIPILDESELGVA